MEHIVQFGINIDDSAIKKMIETNVMNQVAGNIIKDVMKELTGKNDCTKFEYKDKIRDIVIETTENFLNINKDEIILMTSEKLVEKLSKTKVVKDMLTNTLESVLK